MLKYGNLEYREIKKRPQCFFWTLSLALSSNNMQFKNKNSKFITLKEAAALFNYAPDYIGWLIRKGKIPGKKIYSREEWKVSREAILDYVNRNGRKKDYQKERIFSIKKQKYISLKEAARISGYASDYIGYLIRENKIPGKKINFGIVWLTTKDAIKKYQKVKNNNVNKKIKFPFSIIPLILSFGKESRFYFRVPKYSFVFIILGIIIFGGWIAGNFTSNNQNQTIEIYSTSSQGDWQNFQNVRGIPDVGSDGDLNYFSDANSAIYQNGSKNLVLAEFNKTEADFEMINQNNNGDTGEGSSRQTEDQNGQTKDQEGNINQAISFLGKIKNLFTNGSAKAETVPTFTELQNSQFESAKIKFSFALGEKINDLNPTQTQEINPIITTPEEKPSEENQKEVPNEGGSDQQQQEQPSQEQPPQEEQSPNLEPPEPTTPEETPNEAPSIQQEEQSEQETPAPAQQPEQSSPPEQPPQNNTEPTSFWNKFKNLFGDISVFAQEENNNDAKTEMSQPPENDVTPASPAKEELIEQVKEAIPNLDTKIVIWYSLDGELWWQLDTISSYPLSNAQDGGYFSYDAPFLKNWDDVKNLKIKFEGVVGGETTITAYLDSVWVEANYTEQREKPKEKKLLKIKIKDNSLIIPQLKKDFSINEEPVFAIKEPELTVEELVNLDKAEVIGEIEMPQTEIEIPQTKEEEKGLLEKILEPVINFVAPETKAQMNNIKTQIFGPGGLKSDIPPEINSFLRDEKEEFEIKIPTHNERELQPGLYRLELEFETNEAIYILEQEFTWGILAINTNKSIYLPDEQAYLQMAALNDDGHTICGANLQLEIISPQGNILYPEIQKSDECGPNNVTNKPDYFAYYQVGGPGKYEMKLKNIDNNYEITDSFEAQETVPSDVERIGPTRIYPPATYQMQLNVKVNKDFIGVVRESVPVSFELSPLNNADIIIDNQEKIIEWQVDWKTGVNYELSYQFDAPDISPYLYLLGPLKINDPSADSGQVFQEIRQWQIAADAVTKWVTHRSTETVDSVPVVTSNANMAETAQEGVNETTAQVTFGITTGYYIWKPGATNSSTGTPGASPAGFGWWTTNPYLGSSASANWTFKVSVTDSKSTAVCKLRVQAFTNTTRSTTGATLLFNTGDLATDLCTGGTTAPSQTYNPAVINLTTTAPSGTAKYILFEFWVDVTTAGIAGDNIKLNVDGTSDTSISPEGTNTFVKGANITGTIYSDEGSSVIATQPAVAVYKDGTQCTSCTGNANASGVYIIAVQTPASSNTITSYINNDANNKGSLVTTYNPANTAANGKNMTGQDVYKNTVIARGTTAGNVTNADFSDWDNDNDADLLFTANGSPAALAVDTTAELHVWTGTTFAPGGTINASKNLHVDNSGTLSMTGNDLTVGSGSVSNSGGIAVDTGATLSQTASGTTLVLSSNGGSFTVGGGATTFYNFTVGDDVSFSYTCTLGGAIIVSNDLTINLGSGGESNYLDVSNSNYLITVGNNWAASSANAFIPRAGEVRFSASDVGNTIRPAGSPFYNVRFYNGGSWTFTAFYGGGVIIQNILYMTSGTLDSSTNIMLQGTVRCSAAIYCGTINITSAVTFTQQVSANANFQIDYAVLEITWTFYNLTFSSSSGTPTISFINHSLYTHNINVTNNLTIGDGSNTVTVNANDASGNDLDIDVNNNVTINSNATFQASPTEAFTVGGSWLNSNTFTHNSGTVTFDAGSTGKTINAGSSSFYNVTFNNGSGGWAPATNTMTVANNLLMVAGTFATSASGTANVTVNGNVQCSGTCGTIDMTVSGTNTFTQSVAADTAFGTNVAVATDWKFYNLTLTGTSGVRTITFNATGTGQIIINNNLSLTNSGTSLTVNNETNDRILDVNGSVSIGVGTTLQTSSTASFTVAGSWSNSGTFTPGTGTVTFDDTNADGTETLSGTLNETSLFYKVNFNGSGGVWTIQDAMKVDSLATDATDTFQVTAGAVTLGDGTGDNLEVAGGKFTVASGATFQTYASLSQGQSIIIDINHNSSPDNCLNCIISNSGITTISKNVTIRLNSQASWVRSGIEVESTGYLQIKGSLDDADNFGIDSVAHDAGATITLNDAGQSWDVNTHQNKHVRITDTDSLAFGKIYTISSNAANSLTIADDYDTEDGAPTVSGAGPTYTITTTGTSLITADNEGIGQYIFNTTDNQYYKIIDSTDSGTSDQFVVISEPNTVPGSFSGKTIKRADGIRATDNFEILDYAIVTASAGTACNATNNGYIYGKSGSETLIQYADICDMGYNDDYTYGVSFYSVNGANSEEGVKIDKSRIHHGYNGIYLDRSSNNNSTYSAGLTDNAIYSNSSYGIYLYWNCNNNTLSSNTSYSNPFAGIYLAGGDNNTLSSNTSYSNNYSGIQLYSSFNNTLSSNNSYSNASGGIYFTQSYENTLFSNTSYSNNDYGIVLNEESNNNTLSSNNSYSNPEGLRSHESTGNIIINDDYGVSGANSTADIVFNDSNSASNLKLYNVDLTSSTEVTGVTYAGAYIISEKHDSTAGQTKIWGEYTISDNITETVSNDEGIQQFNYADNLYGDSATAHGYSGTGTEDTDIQITLTSALSTAEWYRAEVTTANGDTPTFTITRSGGAANPGTCTLAGGPPASCTYTEVLTGVQFTIQDGASNYVVGDTYTFAVWPKSSDTNTQKTLTFQQAGDTFTAGSGEKVELKGQSNSANRTQITSSSVDTNYYSFDINAGTIDAQYYDFKSLDTDGLYIYGSAIVTELNGGSFDSSQSGGTYIKVTDIATGNDTFTNMVFDTAPNDDVTYSISNPAAGSSSTWTFACAQWRDAYVTINNPSHENQGGNMVFDWGCTTISGTIYTGEGSGAYACSGDNLTVKMEVNGAGDYTGTCTQDTGAYSIYGPFVATDTLTVFLDNETPDAVVVTESPGGDLSGLDLYQNHVIVRHDNGGSLTIDDMNNYDSGDDPDIQFTATNAATDTLTVADGNELYIWTGDTFAPGGNLDNGAGVGIDDIKIVGTYTVSGSESILVSGSWANSGTFTAASSTVTFDSTSSETLSGTLNGSSAFYQVVFNGAGGSWRIQNPMLVSATTAPSLDLKAGTVTLGDISDGDGDNLNVYGGFEVAATAGETATFQTKTDLAQGKTITIHINNPSSPPSCTNCKITVGASSGGGTGQFLTGKNVTLQFNSNASVESGIEVESTGYLQIKGSLDDADNSGIDSVDHDAGATITLNDAGQSWDVNTHQNKHVRITDADSLAFGKIYTISSNAANSLTIADDYNTEDDAPTVSGAGPTYTITTTGTSLITADNESIGQYIFNTTDNQYYKIVDSTDSGTSDQFVVISEPNTVPGSFSGKNIKRADGIRATDNFEILDYAIVTAESTNNGYVWAKAGSETLIQYADISELGAGSATKYGVSFYSINGANSLEGAKIDKSRIHHGYFGIYFNGSSNNNTVNSSGITDNAVYSNSSVGIYIYSSSNNTLSSNTSYSNSSVGIYIYLSLNNILSSNISYSNSPYGIFLSSSSNNILSSNTSYNNSAIGFYFPSSSNNILSSNTSYSNSDYGILLSSDANNNILSSNTSYSNSEGLGSEYSTGNIIINDDYGASGANSTADIVFDDSDSASTLKLYGVDLASSTKVTGVTYTGAYIISEKHDSTAGSTKIWGEYTIPDNVTETVSNDEGLQQFNYADNLYGDSATAHGYSGTGTEDTDIQITLTSALSTAEWYRAEVTTANGDTPIFTITRSGGTANPATYTLPNIYTEASTGVQFTIQDGATDYVLGDTYTFVVWPKSNDVSTQKILAVQQADDKIIVGSGETLELKGGGLTAVPADDSQITHTIAGTWDIDVTNGTATVQESTINDMDLVGGTLTVLNTALNNESAPAAGTTLNVDWYLGTHIVNATTPATNIDTGDTDVTISEITPASTVWKWSGGAGGGWGAPSTSQSTGTDPTNGLIPQPGNNDAIRIREYARNDSGYTYYKYNIQVAEQPTYGDYDYYLDQGNNYIISCRYSDGNDNCSDSDEDDVINENWQRDNIDFNNNGAVPPLNDPPTNGTWYIGMLPMLEFSISSTSVTFDELNPLNEFTNTKTTTLTTTTSARSGYLVTAWSNQIMTHVSYPSQTIADWGGTNGSPTEWGINCPTNGSYCGFGYNTDDITLAGGTANRFSGSKYARFTHTGEGEEVADETGAVTNSQHVITYKISTNAAQAAGDYQTTVIYICTANY